MGAQTQVLVCHRCRKVIHGTPIQVEDEVYCSWECSEDENLEIDEEE